VRIALDTNRYTDFARGDAGVVERLELAERVFVPFVVLAELRAGFAVGRRGKENERFLHRFLRKPGVETLYVSDATTRAYADLYRQLRDQGTPIPTNDLWIAALVVEHGLTLFTRDPHFARLAQLDRLEA
jgi:tRNA(fMet)-specific endonuclease VapC